MAHDAWILAATLAATSFGLACSPAGPGGAPPSQPSAPPVAVGGSAAPLGTAVASSTAVPGAKPEPPWAACTPQMFDHPPGNHDRYGFQDDRDDRYGYRDAAGKVVIEPRFFFAYEFSAEGVAAVISEQGPLFIRPDGQVLAQAFLLDNGPDYFSEGRARIVRDGKVGFIDAFGKVVIEPRYDHARAFCHARSLVCTGCAPETGGEHPAVVGGRWGMLDRAGALVVPLSYDAALELDATHVTFELAGKAVTLGLDGRPRPAP